MLFGSPLSGSRRIAALVACALVPLAAAAPASAATSTVGCASTATKKAFAKFGDNADYSLLPGGSFEVGTKGWALGGASVVTGNETAFIGSTRDTKSLAVPAKARVVSPVFCVGVEHPTFRLFAKKRSGTWQQMAVKLRWSEKNGAINETTVGSLNGNDYATWKPTPAFKLAQTLPLWASGQTLNVQIVLDPEDWGGDWQVDDLYIDPLRRA